MNNILLALLCLLCLGACPAKPPALPTARSDYQDHTQSNISSAEELLSLGLGGSYFEVKFVITNFNEPSATDVFYLDSRFYRMHDEWYWFRLLNGQSVSGWDTSPVQGEPFDSVSDVYAHYRSRKLPLDLDWAPDGRLYSKKFYPSCFGRRRFFGIGSLLFSPRSATQEATLAFQLELTDDVNEAQLEHFFSVLRASLPVDIADDLVWLPRSNDQQRLAATLKKRFHPLSAYISNFDELKITRAVEVYNEGLTAGNLRLWQYASPSLGQTKPDDIVVLQYTTTFLPSAAGLITADPQTPLAHINLLAKNRNIPNVFAANIFSDETFQLDELSNKPVILQAFAPDTLKITEFSKKQLDEWKKLQQKKTLSQKRASTKKDPLLYSLNQIKLDTNIKEKIGGKAAGFALLYSVAEVEAPPQALVLGTRAYDEHMQSFAKVIDAIVSDKEFQEDARLRFLAVEGKKKYLALYPDKRLTMRKFLWRHRDDGVKKIVEEGGLRKAIRKKPLKAATLQKIEEELEANFAPLSKSQGLRLRSSSTIEDIEGFNGAGLYTSESAFLDPIKAGKKKKTIERAIQEVWSSYWSFEATEERHLEAIDHRGGAMAVVIHPKFDDELEVSNAVITFTLSTNGESRMVLNIQEGAVSVTNPNARDLPEEDILTQKTNETPSITLRKASTLAVDLLLTEDELRSLFAQSKKLTEAALQNANQGLTEAQRRRTFTLDIELRQVREGWPMLASGEVLPTRFIFKQARSLEPEARGIPKELYKQEIPRDLLARARKIEEHSCIASPASASISLRFLSLFTEPSANAGYTYKPFTAWVEFTQNQQTTTLTPVHFASLERPTPSGVGAWALRLKLTEDAAKSANLSQLHIEKNSYSLWSSANEQKQGTLRCETKELFVTPSSYLLRLVP